MSNYTSENGQGNLYCLENATDLAFRSANDTRFARHALPLRLLASGYDLRLCVSFERLGYCVHDLNRELW